MMSCADAAKNMSDQVNTSVSRRIQWGLRIHLIMCRGCRRYRQQLAFLHRWLRSLPAGGIEAQAHGEITLPQAAKKRIQTRIEAALARAGQP